MALPSRTLFGSTRGAVRRRRPAEGRVLGVEQLDRRQMLSANAMASFGDVGYGLLRELNATAPTAASVWTTKIGQATALAEYWAEPVQLPQPNAALLGIVKVVPAAIQPRVSLSNGVLTVTGTSGADTVEVRQNGDRIEIVGANVGQPLRKGSPFTVQDGMVSLPASLVKQIKIDGGAGDDTIKVRTYEMSADVITKVSINAGAGNDRVEVGVDGAMAKKVFADLGKGTDTLVLPAGVSLGAAKQAEKVDYVPQYVQNRINPMDGLFVDGVKDHRKDLTAGALRGTMDLRLGTLHRRLSVTRTADGYEIARYESGCFNTTTSRVSISDADLAGPADALTDDQRNALDALHWMLSATGSTYGTRIGKEGVFTQDFQDGDGDGIDDREQSGPGQPRVPPVSTLLLRFLPRFDPNKVVALSHNAG